MVYLYGRDKKSLVNAHNRGAASVSFFTHDDRAIRAQSQKNKTQAQWAQNRRPLKERLTAALNQLRSKFRKGEQNPQSSFTYFVENLDGTLIPTGLNADVYVQMGHGYETAIVHNLQQIGVCMTEIGLTVEEDQIELPSTEHEETRYGKAVIVTLCYRPNIPES